MSHSTPTSNRSTDTNGTKPQRPMSSTGEGSLMGGDFSGNAASAPATTTSPALSIASAAAGVIGVVLALFVSWLLSVIVGVVAILLGRAATRREAPYPKLALVGKILGFICAVANTALMVLYIYQLMSLGLL